MKNNYTPEIRFFEFTDDWELRALSEFLEFSNGINAPKEKYGKGKKMISVMDILSPYPINYDRIRSSVDVDKSIEQRNKVEYGDLVFVRSSEVSEEVGWAKAYLQNTYALYSGFTIRGKKKSKFNAFFVELSINTANRKQIECKAGGSTRFNVSQSILSSVQIKIPHFEEQEKIGYFFHRIDNLIILQQRELDELKQTKQGFLQKMFPKEGESIPELRFHGCTDAWEQRKFFDNIKRTIDFRGRTPKKLGMDWSETGYLALSALNVKNGYIDPEADAHYGNEALYSKWMSGAELKKGQVLFTTEAPMGNVAQVPDDRSYILSQRTIAFETDCSKMNNDFFAVLLKSPNVFNALLSLSSGGTAKGVSQKSLSGLKVTVPVKIEEQKKIGTLFKGLDSTIALHQRELEVLKETKKALLQKMFIKT